MENVELLLLWFNVFKWIITILIIRWLMIEILILMHYLDPETLPENIRKMVRKEIDAKQKEDS